MNAEKLILVLLLSGTRDNKVNNNITDIYTAYLISNLVVWLLNNDNYKHKLEWCQKTQVMKQKLSDMTRIDLMVEPGTSKFMVSLLLPL